MEKDQDALRNPNPSQAFVPSLDYSALFIYPKGAFQHWKFVQQLILFSLPSTPWSRRRPRVTITPQGPHISPASMGTLLPVIHIHSTVLPFPVPAVAEFSRDGWCRPEVGKWKCLVETEQESESTPSLLRTGQAAEVNFNFSLLRQCWCSHSISAQNRILIHVVAMTYWAPVGQEVCWSL